MSEANKAVSAMPKSGLYVRARPGLILRDAKVARLKRKLYVQADWLTEADDAIARRFCELQVLIEQVYAFIRTTGVLSQTGEVKTAVDAHRRMTLAQNQLARNWGSRRQRGWRSKRTARARRSICRPRCSRT